MPLKGFKLNFGILTKLTFFYQLLKQLSLPLCVCTYFFNYSQLTVARNELLYFLFCRIIFKHETINMSSSSSSTIPPSPRHVLQQSIALSDALNGAFTFASISAAHFSAITAPLPLALPARTAAPSSSICTAYASVPSKESNMPRRYNLRSSTSSQSEKENCQMNVKFLVDEFYIYKIIYS